MPPPGARPGGREAPSARPDGHPLHQLQRQIGNRAVAGLVQPSAVPTVQRDDAPAAGGTAAPAASAPTADTTPKPKDISVQLPTPPPLSVSTEQLAALDPSYRAPARPGVEPAGETPPADPQNMMAIWAPGGPSELVRPVNVQRDPPSGGGSAPAGGGTTPAGGSSAAPAGGSSPHLGVDVQLTYPLALQVSYVLRDYNLRQIPGVLRGLDILHEPSVQFSVSIAPQAGVSAQLGASLFNLHLPSLFGSELEAAITAQVAADPAAGISFGPGIQLEQHIWPALSVTASLNALWTVPTDGTPTTFALTPGAGLLIHIP